MIRSRQNPRLKDIRRLRRSKGDEALLEGPHLIGEAVAAGRTLTTLLATSEFLASAAGRRLAPHLPFPPLEVEASLLEEVADSDSPRGIVGVARLPRAGAEALPAVEDGVYVWAERMQDPGNLGALGRVAEASGAAGFALAAGGAHPNHPRALRASAGSLLRLPLAYPAGAADLERRLAPFAPRWLALVPRGGEDLYAARLDGVLVLALGGEGAGLSAAVRERCRALTIPMAPPVESLNVTVAAGVALFEIRRRRS